LHLFVTVCAASPSLPGLTQSSLGKTQQLWCQRKAEATKVCAVPAEQRQSVRPRVWCGGKARVPKMKLDTQRGAGRPAVAPPLYTARFWSFSPHHCFGLCCRPLERHPVQHSLHSLEVHSAAYRYPQRSTQQKVRSASCSPCRYDDDRRFVEVMIRL